MATFRVKRMIKQGTLKHMAAYAWQVSTTVCPQLLRVHPKSLLHQHLSFLLVPWVVVPFIEDSWRDAWRNEWGSFLNVLFWLFLPLLFDRTTGDRDWKAGKIGSDMQQKVRKVTNLCLTWGTYATNLGRPEQIWLKGHEMSCPLKRNMHQHNVTLMSYS